MEAKKDMLSMTMEPEKKQEIIGTYRVHEQDTGSPEVQVALLTIYDMCKAVDRGMVIGDVCLVHKSGGKSGSWTREP